MGDAHDIPEGLTLGQAYTLMCGLSPWWHAILGGLTLWCQHCLRPVFPCETEPRNEWGLAPWVSVAITTHGQRLFVVVSCCGHVLAEGVRP